MSPRRLAVTRGRARLRGVTTSSVLRSVVLPLVLVPLALACGKEAPPTETPAPGGQEEPPDDDPEPTERPELTAAECESQGGVVVGDIGDGAVHRPDYTCPETSQPPIGTIVAEDGGPMGVEGAVCCAGDL